MKIGRWLAFGVGIVSAAVVLAVLVTVIIGYTAYKPANPGWIGVAGKTLWDWLGILIIPFVIAVTGTLGGYFFTRSENRAAQAIADKRTQDEALQGYLDQMSQMLLDKDHTLRRSKNDDDVRLLARARTLTLLQRVDGDHKRSVLQFLAEARLISSHWPASEKHPPIISLADANLDHADFKGLQLGFIDLSKASLRHADMTRYRLMWALVMATWRLSRLDGADLSFAKLRDASLQHAYMKGAILCHAELTGAVLSAGDLTNADLTGATLTNAALNGTNLTDAKVTKKQLRACKSLSGATMPDGQVLKGDPKVPDAPTFEEWVKGREDRREDGRDSSSS